MHLVTVIVCLDDCDHLVELILLGLEVKNNLFREVCIVKFSDSVKMVLLVLPDALCNLECLAWGYIYNCSGSEENRRSHKLSILSYNIRHLQSLRRSYEYLNVVCTYIFH